MSIEVCRRQTSTQTNRPILPMPAPSAMLPVHHHNDRDGLPDAHHRRFLHRNPVPNPVFVAASTAPAGSSCPLFVLRVHSTQHSNSHPAQGCPTAGKTHPTCP